MSDDQFLKAVAAAEVQLNADTRRAVIEEHSSATKWLMASLLTLNAGGLAVLGRHFDGSTSEVVAAIAFYVGIVAALLIGWFGQRANRASIEHIRALEVFWVEVGSTSKFDDARFKSLSDNLKTAGKHKSTHSGWISLAAFSVGLAALALPHVHLHLSHLTNEATAYNVAMPADLPVSSDAR